MTLVLEDREGWLEEFRSGWLAHYKQTGEVDWARYTRPRNSRAPEGEAVKLSESRLMLITTSGAYLAKQPPFDTADDLGDYTIRIISSAISLPELQFAHGHYDPAAVEEDPQVLVPLEHLRVMVKEGLIGSLTENFISFMGYQPDVIRVIDELIPQIVDTVRKERARAALLVPA